MSAGRSRLGSNALFLLLQGAGGSVFGILQIKLFTLSLGREGYSLFLVLRGLAVLMAAVAVMGLPQLAQRFLPQLETRGERGHLLRSLGLLLAGALFAFALVALLAGRFWGQLAGHFTAELVGGDLFRETLLLALSLGLAELVSGFYQGLRRMGPMALAEILSLAGLTLHLFLLREGLHTGLAMNLFSGWFLARALTLLILLPRWLPRGAERQGESPLRIDRRQLLDYWLLSLPLRWLGLAYFELDRYVIGMVAALELVALFHVPARLVGVSKRFLAAPVLSFQTEVSRLYEERREGELAAGLQLFLRGQLAISLWIAAALFLLGKPLLLLVSTGDYLSSLPLLGLLLLTLPLGSLVAVLEAALRGLDGLRPVLLGNLLWALVYYGSLPWLIGELGLPGLGMAQLGAGAMQAVWVLMVGGKRRWLRGATHGVLAALIWGLLPALVALTAALAWPGRSGLAPAPVGIAGGLVLLLLGALLVSRGEGVLRGEEKRWLLARLPGPFGHPRLARLLRATGEEDRA
jgi:O-antigen/teichoic acid export membrane protein